MYILYTIAYQCTYTRRVHAQGEYMHAPPLHVHVYFIGRHTGDNAIIQTMGRCRQLRLRNSCQYNNDK